MPWDEVGDGWVLTTIIRGAGTARARARARSLELISPEGTRYSLYATSKQPLKNNVDPSNFTLIDWDPDTRVALLKRYVSLHRSQAIRVDLQSRLPARPWRCPSGRRPTGLRPDGSGRADPEHRRQDPLDHLGRRRATLLGQASPAAAPITTPDGTAVVIAGADHLTVMPLDGSATSDIATPGECRPLRWYDDTQLLASCYTRKGSQLVTVGLDGTVTPRASLRATRQPATSADRAGTTPTCASSAAAPTTRATAPAAAPSSPGRTPRATPKLVRVPGSTGGISLVDARDDRLVIAHTATCDAGAPRAVLSLFDPVSKDEDVLLTLGRREHWGHVLAWDEPRPWGYYVRRARPVHRF